MDTKLASSVDLSLGFQYDDNGYIDLKDYLNMHNTSRRVNKGERGQSFVELSLVVVFLMIFVAGIVEFGFMLNDYLNLVDASREAVRFSSNYDPFIIDPVTGTKSVDENFYYQTADLTEQVLAPLKLDRTLGDDIVISFFSVDSSRDIFIRYPSTDGWSYFGNKVSNISNAEVKSRLDSGAPPTGVLLVEIFYNYPHRLSLPLFTVFVRDPMPVYVYSIMPLPAAEPE